jgi:hypothetical protein
MSKPWIIFLFVLWTLALIVISPILLSFTRISSSTVHLNQEGIFPPLNVTITTTRPILDWTGRFSNIKFDYSVDSNDYEVSPDGLIRLKSEAASRAKIIIGSNHIPTIQIINQEQNKAEQGAAANP